jgi:hypothetical protein
LPSRAPAAWLQNRDFDTGKLTAPAEYSLADNTYAKLVRTVEEKRIRTRWIKLRADLLGFYRERRPPFATKKRPKGVRSTLNWKAEAMVAYFNFSSHVSPGMFSISQTIFIVSKCRWRTWLTLHAAYVYSSQSILCNYGPMT